MNNINLIGRLTRDIELRNVGESKVGKFTLAVNRKFKNKNGEYEADFINCIAWNKTAEIMAQYLKKGNQLGVSGRLEIGFFEKEDGTRVNTHDVVVNDFTFVSTPKKTEVEDAGSVKTDVYQEFADEQIELNQDDLPF